jgi:dTDP-4-amino-4,6-dideoxygalactose transaminase
MWPRKQLDIDWADFAFGLRSFFRPSPGRNENILPAGWIPTDEAIVSLSVRTGWDLLLTALGLPPDSEIIMSAVTIPDMARIVENHCLVPVPIDIDAQRLEPDLDDLEQSISPRTRAILVAHLFGSRIDMAPIIDVARQHRLLVIEDCAQAFVGRAYAGHPESDCSMFSFGPIKTATALGGAVLRVRDGGLREKMALLQHAYPLQSKRAYLARLGKYLSFRVLCRRRTYGALVRGYRALGIDYDAAFSHAAHSFGQNNFFERIRRRPCGPLLNMLKRQLNRFEHRGLARLARRTACGAALANKLPVGMVVGAENPTHTYWALLARVANRQEVLTALRAAGFDATARSSLVPIAGPLVGMVNGHGRAAWLEETIFLPNGDDMPDCEWQRMSAILSDVARAIPTPEPPRLRERLAPARVSVPL